MNKLIIIAIILFTSLTGQSYSVTISRDNFSGDAEGILQYFHNGKIESIRGNISKPSSDGNISVKRDPYTGNQIFRIQNVSGLIFNIWLVNSMMDEDFAEDEDFHTLSESNANVEIKNLQTGKTDSISVPQDQPGLAFRVGSIIDGEFIQDTEMYQHLRMFRSLIVDAINGQPIEGVEVNISSHRPGDYFEPGFTDNIGVYEQQFDYGKYEIIYSKAGYIPYRQKFSIDLTDLPVTMTTALTPKTKKYRIVLTWGANPKDLDIHLSGPKPEGGYFHIWWNNKVLVGGKNFLDRDDTSSYGPETITIYEPADGNYILAVHNYSHRNQSNTQSLSHSNARVDVYNENQLQNTFQISLGEKGNVWEVFQLNSNGTIIPINNYYDENKSENVIR